MSARLFVLSIVLVGCGSSKDDRATDSAVPPASWNDACAAHATAWCRYAAACTPEWYAFASEAECEQAASATCMGTFSTSSLDASSYKACLDGWNAVESSCITLNPLVACLQGAASTVGPGEACSLDSYVEGVGLVIDSGLVPNCRDSICEGATGSCGTCVAGGGVGAPCVGDNYCDPSAHLYCDNSGGSPAVCAKLAREGESCNGKRCDPSVPLLYCHDTTKTCELLPRGVGTPCTGPCAGTLWCGPAGTCVAGSGPGATCEPLGLRCDISLGLACLGGTCEFAEHDLGTACPGSQCWKSACSSMTGAGTCNAFVPAGGACSPDGTGAVCAPPYSCHAGVCGSPTIRDVCP